MCSSDLPELERFEHPLASRYASKAMVRLLSPLYRQRVWRRLWVALAESEREPEQTGLDLKQHGAPEGASASRQVALPSGEERPGLTHVLSVGGAEEPPLHESLHKCLRQLAIEKPSQWYRDDVVLRMGIVGHDLVRDGGPKHAEATRLEPDPLSAEEISH